MSGGIADRIDREGLKRLSVLYVEDDEDVREEVTRLLGRFVGKLHIATNGQEGIELYLRHHPDIIITDITMPVMDGLSMARHLREDDPDTPIIVTSAYNDLGFLHQALDSGIDKYLLKPLTVGDLLGAVGKLGQMALQRREIESKNASLRLAADVFENAHEGLLVANSHRLLESVNPAFYRITGIPPIHVLGKPVESLEGCGLDTRDIQRIFRTAESLGASQEDLSFEATDGRQTFIQFSVVLTRSEDGGIQNYIISITDITARKSAEQRQKEINDNLAQLVQEEVSRKLESEARFHAIFEAIDDMMIVVSPSLEILYANQATLNRTDLQPGAALSLAQLLRDKKLVRRWRERIRRVFRFGERIHAEDHDILGEEEIFSESAVFPIRDSQERISAVGVLRRDISARKRAEIIAEQRQLELAHFSRVSIMGEMSSALAHEINQPLTSLLNYLKGCLRRLDSGNLNDQQLRDVLQQMAGQAERAAGVVSHIRNFSRKHEAVKTTVDLAAVIREMIGFADIEARRRQVQLIADIPPNLPQVTAVKVQIEQVLINLIKNAIDAMDGTRETQREVVIAARHLDDGITEVSVIDHGKGLQDTDPDRLFFPFYTTKKDGMGMGLAVCRDIMESHRGRLWAEENPQGGSIFRFTLPDN